MPTIFCWHVNWFSSVPLLDGLKVDGNRGTGNIRADRCKKAPFAIKAELEKQGRGLIFYACDGSNMLVRSCDNAMMSIASNCQLSNSSRLVSRWSKKQKKNVDVPLPLMIHSYNRCMEEVDLFNQFVANYHIRIKSKK